MKIWTFGALQKYFRLTCRYLRSECLLCNFDWLCLASNQISSFAKRHKLGADIFFDKLVAYISMEMPPHFFLQPTIRVIKGAHRMCSSDHDSNWWWTSLFMNTLHYRHQDHHHLHLANDYAQPRADHQDHQEVNNNHSCQWSDLRQNTPIKTNIMFSSISQISKCRCICSEDHKTFYFS